MLNQRAKQTRDEVKLLLLGPGESGKSTIFKQMKIIGAGGYNTEELKSFKPIIHSNCITQMQVLISAMPPLNIQYESPDNQARGERLANLPSTADSWTSDVGADIKHLWHDAGIQKVFTFRDKEFQLNDSADYFFNNIDRFLDNNFIPTEQDVLRARVRSTGIDEAEFEVEDFSFRMLDVGGQRSERRKWIHCFDCVTSVLFCTSLSEYDQTLREDDSQNRMKESLLLFDEIRNSPWFRSTPFMLFLNKTDLFREKMEVLKIPLTTCFEEYKGANTYSAGSDYIRDKFLALNMDGKKVYVHLTCAISTENVKVVFNVVRTTLMNNTLDDLQL